ncbi:Bacterial Ig-like domain (group 2) [compost metagenome]
MRLANRRKLFIFGGIAAVAIVLVAAIWAFMPDVEATDNDTHPIRILEITDPTSSTLGTDGSELASLKGQANITVDTVTMKKFVSLRDNWDGKYDAVYIAKGDYSKTLVDSLSSYSSDKRSAAHNTLAVQNDITNLKVQEIKSYFIDKGLYVFLRDETFTNQNTAAKQGKLYAAFNPYRTATGTKSNVVFLKGADLDTFIQKIINRSTPYLAGLTCRPQLTITNRSDLISYSSDPRHTYSSGDTLSFSIRLGNVSANLANQPVRVKLYMNIDSSAVMTENDVVAALDMKSQSGTLTYKLPQTFSGPLYWKLEASDPSTGLKSSDSDSILYKGIKPVIKVLQVMPAGKTGSTLTASGNMDQTYLTQQYLSANNLSSADYQLVISTMDMKAFNSYIEGHASAADPTSGLNGVYDMIIFGFQDMYDRITTPMISEKAAQAVKAFAVQTKQSLMLTHDTIFEDPSAPYAESKNSDGTTNYNYWSYYFHELVGQSMPRTYLGGEAVNSAITVVPVNSGLLTQYPFNLSTVPLKSDNTRYQVARTHDQFFPLDLERADVIPWYNIKSDANMPQRDTDDTYNHFYTYSVGTITFSGTGHSNTNFPDWEQKLFVNTMYRAFAGANHAPEITVKTPTDNLEKPSYQDKIMVSYTVQDYDLKDKELTTNLQFKVGDTPLQGYSVQNKAVLSGDTVSFTFDNPLPRGGQLTIEITAKDKQGAASLKTVHVPITRIDSNLTIGRTLSSSTVERDKPVTVQYTVTPDPVPYLSVETGDQGIESLVISNVKYEETFPANLEVSGLSVNGASTGFTRTGSLQQGYTLSRSLGDIQYKLSEVNGVKMYVPNPANPITFSVSVVPKVKQSYWMDNSKITFEDIHATAGATAAPTPSPSASPTPAASFPGSSASVNALGIASDYSVFMLNQINFVNSGFSNNYRMAAGGNISIGSFSLGGSLGSNPAGATVVAGGNLSLSMNGGSLNGTAYYGGTVSAPSYLLGQTRQNANYMDFNSIGSALKSRSAGLASLSKTADTYYDPNGSVVLTGTKTDLNVFEIKADAARELHSITFNVPSGSTVLLNIAGTDDKLINGSINLNGVSTANVLYNYYQATSLSIQSYGIVYGTILAPMANISFTGSFEGSVIGGSITEGSGGHSFTGSPFSGSLPDTPSATPTPAATASPPPASASPSASPTVREMKTLYFSPLAFEAIVKVSAITLSDANVRVGSEVKLFPVITPDDANNKNVAWTSANPGIASVDPNTGVVKGITAGETTVTVTVRDGSNVSATAHIHVISPNLSIQGPGIAKVGESISLQAVYNTIQETVTGYEWSVQGGNSATGSITKSAPDGSTAVFQATQSGTYTVQVTVKTDANPSGVTATKTITVGLNGLVIQGTPNVYLNNSTALTAVPDPVTASHEQYAWSLVNSGDLAYGGFVDSQGNTVASLTTSSATVSFKGTGVTDGIGIIVTAAGTTSSAFTVKVLKEPDLQFYPSSGVIAVGDKLELLPNLHTIPFGDVPQNLIPRLHWSILGGGSSQAVSLTQSGTVTGLRKGSEQIQVSYQTVSGNTVTATYTIKVTAPEDTGENRY